MHREIEHVRDDVLHFGWMLSRRTDEDRAVFASLGAGRICLEIEMILTAERDLALELQGRSCQGAFDIAAPNVIWFGVKTLCCDSFLGRKNCGQGFVFDDDLGGSGAASLGGFTNNKGHDLPVIKSFMIGEKNLIVPDRADIVQTRDIFRQQHGRDARHGARH